MIRTRDQRVLYTPAMPVDPLKKMCPGNKSYSSTSPKRVVTDPCLLSRLPCFVFLHSLKINAAISQIDENTCWPLT